MYGGGFVRRGFCPEGVLSAHRINRCVGDVLNSKTKLSCSEFVNQQDTHKKQ